MSSNTVQLYIYDLSGGVAAKISPRLIGKQIDGIWHTSIVVYEREYFFGSNGIETCVPGKTVLGDPLEKINLGETQVPYAVFNDYLRGLAESSYTASSYNLFQHNCNTFSQELAQFLCGASIPKYILDLPNEVLNTSLGPAITLLAEQLEKSARPLNEEATGAREQSPDLEHLNFEIDEARFDTEEK